MLWNEKKNNRHEIPHPEAEPLTCMEKKEINDKIPDDIVEKYGYEWYSPSEVNPCIIYD